MHTELVEDVIRLSFYQTYDPIVYISQLYYRVNKFHFKVLKRNKKKNIRVIELIKQILIRIALNRRQPDYSSHTQHDYLKVKFAHLRRNLRFIFRQTQTESNCHVSVIFSVFAEF
jgi:hypothetical protein